MCALLPAAGSVLVAGRDRPQRSYFILGVCYKEHIVPRFACAWDEVCTRHQTYAVGVISRQLPGMSRCVCSSCAYGRMLLEPERSCTLRLSVPVSTCVDLLACR